MSVKVMAYVWDLEIPTTEKIVLLAYADHADHEGNNIFPANETISRKTGLAVRTVQRTKKKLIKDKLMQRRGWTEKTPRYSIPMGGVRVSPMPENDVEGDSEDKKEDLNDNKVSPVSPEPSFNHQEPSLTINPLSLWIKQFGNFPRSFNTKDDNTLAIEIHNLYTKHGQARFMEVFDWVKFIQAKDYGSRVRAFSTAFDTWGQNKHKDTPENYDDELKDGGYERL
jgi:hypothetical protein